MSIQQSKGGQGNGGGGMPPATAVLWDAQTVADYWGVTREWVYHQTKLGRIPCVRVLGALLRYESEVIMAMSRGGR